MARKKTKKIVITDNRSVPTGYLLVPEKYDPPGPPSTEGPVLLSEEEKKYVEARFGPPKMTKYGLLSYADDSASSTGMSRGDASQDTVGSDQRTSSGSEAASRGTGSVSGGSRSQGAAGTSGGPGGQGTGGRPSGGSSSQGAAGAGGGPGAGGGGGQGDKGGGGGVGTSNNAGQNMGTRGGVQANAGSNNAGQNMGTRGGVQANAGTKGGAPTTGAVKGNDEGSYPAGSFTNAPRQGTVAPGSAMGLLNATAKPKDQSRIGPERVTDVDPLSSYGRVVGSYMDPMNPVGLPARQERWAQGLQEIKDLENKGVPEEQRLGSINYKAKQVADVAPSPYDDPNIPTIGDVINWGRRSITAQQDILGTPKGKAATAIGEGQVTTTNIAKAMEDLGIDINTPATADVMDAIMSHKVQTGQPDLGDWDESIGKPKNAAAKERALADFAAGEPPGMPFGSAVNIHDPIAMGGFDFSNKTPTHGVLGTDVTDVPSRTLLGESTSGVRNPSYTSPQNNIRGSYPEDTRVSPAGGPPVPGDNLKTQDRATIDPNFDPRTGNDLNERMWDTKAINDPTGDFSFPNRKAVKDPERVPEDPNFNPNALQPETENVPAPTRSLVNAPKLQDRIPPDPNYDYRTAPEPSDIDWSQSKNKPFPGQKNIPQDTTPIDIATAQPTEVTKKNSTLRQYGEPTYDDPTTGTPVDITNSGRVPSIGRVNTGKSSDTPYANYVPTTVNPQLFSGIAASTAVNPATDVAPSVLEQTIAQLGPVGAQSTVGAANAMIAAGMAANKAGRERQVASISKAPKKGRRRSNIPMLQTPPGAFA